MQKTFSVLSFLVLIFVLVFAAFAKGGNTVWAREIIIVGAMLACLLLPWGSLEQKPSGLWLLPWMVLTVFVSLQLLGSDAGSGFVFKTEMPLQTVAYWAIFSAYWALAWLVSGLSMAQMRWLAGILVVLACFQALYGLVAFLGGQETILGLWDKEYYKADVTGTFVNRNHFAGYLALLWGLGLSWFLSYENKAGSRPSIALRVGLALIFSLILVIAILGSHSRLGMIAGLFSVFVWIYLYVRRGHAQSPWAKPVLISLVVVVLFGMVWFGLGRLLLRFAAIGENTRYLVWDTMLNLPLSTWLYGVGAGSFADYFGTIVPFNIQGDVMFYEAHNDWLEFVLDFGLIGAVLIAAGFMFWFIKMQPERWSLIQVGALCGILAIAVHSLGDFNLQIPGVGVTFWVTLGILMNPNISQQQVDLARRGLERKGSRRRRKRRASQELA